MFAVAAMLGGVAALLAGLTLMGVAFLLFGVAFLLGGVAALLDGWSLVGIPFLLLGVAALLGGVAALLDEWTVVGVPFLLLGVAALLGGVALLYRPELPQRLVAWLTKRDDLPLTAAGTSAIGAQRNRLDLTETRRKGIQLMEDFPRGDSNRKTRS